MLSIPSGALDELPEEVGGFPVAFLRLVVSKSLLGGGGNRTRKIVYLVSSRLPLEHTSFAKGWSYMLYSTKAGHWYRTLQIQVSNFHSLTKNNTNKQAQKSLARRRTFQSTLPLQCNL